MFLHSIKTDCECPNNVDMTVLSLLVSTLGMILDSVEQNAIGLIPSNFEGEGTLGMKVTIVVLIEGHKLLVT